MPWRQQEEPTAGNVYNQRQSPPEDCFWRKYAQSQTPAVPYEGQECAAQRPVVQRQQRPEEYFEGGATNHHQNQQQYFISTVPCWTHQGQQFISSSSSSGLSMQQKSYGFYVQQQPFSTDGCWTPPVQQPSAGKIVSFLTLIFFLKFQSHFRTGHQTSAAWK